MKTPNQVMFFPNGHTAVFDKSGNQIPQLQRSWIINFAKFMLENGAEDLAEVMFTLPNGNYAWVFKTEDGYNVDIRAGKGQ